MELFLSIWVVYHMISFTAADETNDVSRTNEDNYALRLVSSEIGPKNSYKGVVEASDDSRTAEDDYIFGITSTEKSPRVKEEDKEYEAEKKKGDMADLFGTNQHHSYPEYYKDLGRRFVPQYPYKEVLNINEDDEDKISFDSLAKDSVSKNLVENHLIPVKASPELVLAVAAKSALLEAATLRNPLKENVINKEILRSGDYWDDVWREDVDTNILRTHVEDVVQPVKVKIMPDSKLYNLASELKKISPRLVYVINKE